MYFGKKLLGNIVLLFGCYDSVKRILWFFVKLDMAKFIKYLVSSVNETSSF